MLAILVSSELTLSSCKSKMDDPYLLDVLDKGILGMTPEELEKADPHIADRDYHPMQKDMEDGTSRIKYVVSGDAFVNGGKWITTVYYYFTDGKLTSYNIEYRQSDYSEGMCAKRMSMFTEYLDAKYGTATDTYVVMGEYAVKGSAWKIAGGTFDMSRQNGGWILFTYHE